MSDDQLLGNARIRIRPDFSGFERETKDGLASSMRSAAKTAAAVAATATAAAAGAAAANLFAGSIQSASDYEQAMGSLTAVFGPATTAMQEHSKAAANLGLSQAQYAQSAAVLGAQLGNLGIAQKDLAPTTDALMTSAADMAAQFGGTTAEAVDALSALMRGERDPIERYGVSINDAGLKAKMAATGLDQTHATLALLNEQLGKSNTVGAAAREMDSYASSTQRMQAKMENARAQIGAAFLPALSSLAELGGRLAERFGPTLANAVQTVGQKLSEVGGWVQQNVLPAIRDLVGWLERNKDVILPIAAAIGGMVLAWKGYQEVMAASRAVMTAITAVQWALNAAMAANPVGIVVLAIAGLVAAFAALYASNSGFRDWVQGVWQGIKDFMAPIIDWFRRTIPPLWEKISDAVSTAMGIVSDVIKRVWGFIGPFVTGYLQTMWNVYSTVFKAVWSVVSETMETIWSVIRTVWNFIYPFVSQYLQTMWNVYSTIFKAVWSVVSTVMDAIWSVIKVIWGVIGPFVTGVLKEMWANVVNIFDGIKAAISLAMNVVKAIISDVWNGIKWVWDNVLSGVWDTTVRIFDWVHDKISTALDKVKALFTGAVDAIGKIWNSVTDLVKEPIRGMFDWINKHMIAPINSVLGKFSDSVKLGELPTGFAQGGYVSGPGGPTSDSIPARLSNGEYVVRAAQTAKYRPLLEAMNAGRFGIGGPGTVAQIFGWLKGQGLSDAGAAGVMGNFQAESGMDPAAVEPNGAGHGLAQWSFSRWSDLQNFAAGRGTPWSDLGTQLAFFAQEISAGYGGMWSQLRTASDPVAASQLFANTFERPGTYGSRDNFAQLLFGQISSGMLTADSSSNSLWGSVVSGVKSMVSGLVKAVTDPAMGALRSTFGGNWAGDLGIGMMQHVIDQVLAWAGAQDSATTGTGSSYGGVAGAWRIPLAQYTVTSEYGMRVSPTQGGAPVLHAGIDLGDPEGTPVLAAAAGQIARAGWNDGYGNFIQIDHGGGLATEYGHMSAINAAAGQIVAMGDIIGAVGSTGDSTGAHLHFNTLTNGRYEDPRSFMAARGLQFDSGGYLPRGWSAVYNGTDSPEPVLTDKQWKRMNNGQATGPVFNITNIHPQAEPASVTTSRALRLLTVAGGL